MSEPISGQPVELRVSGSTWRFRVATYLRALARPRAFAPLAVAALFPVALERAVWWSLGETEMFVSAVLAGVAAVAALVAASVLAAALRSVPPRIVVLDDRGIREHVGRRVVEHTWAFITNVVEDDRSLTLHCREPMKSFQLASSSRALLLVVDKARPDFPRLRQLVDAHASAPPRR